MSEERNANSGQKQDAPEKNVPKDLDVGEYVESFSALKDSLFQGRDLRKQQRALDSYAGKTADMRKTHADQVNILANYDVLVADQRQILQEAQDATAAAKPKLEQTSADLAAAQGKLEAMKAEHKSELAELKARGDRTAANLDKVASEAKGARKRAEDQYKAAAQTKEGVGADQTARLKAVLDDAKAQERSASDALKDAKTRAKQMQRDKKQACDEAERPLQDQISKLKTEQRKLQDEIAANNKKASDAKARIEYCRQVHENPAATDELKAQIAEREDVERQMRGRIDSLAQTHAASKESAKKARIVTIVAVVLIIAIVIAVLVALNR